MIAFDPTAELAERKRAYAKSKLRPRADYDMSRPSRFVRERTGLASQGSGADYHYRNEWAYYRDIEKARDMDRNDCIIGQTIDRAVANIIQDGFALDPKTGDRKLDADLWARWQAWSCEPEQVELSGEFCWHDLERHTCRAMMLDGDIVHVGLIDGMLQTVEAHSVRGGPRDNTVLGVTKDDYGRRLQYWIAQEPIEPWANGTFEASEPVEVRTRDGFRQLFHVYNPKRVTQTRGVTALAPIFIPSGQFEDIQFAKLIQQQVTSYFAIFRRKVAQPPLPTTTGTYGDSSTQQSPSGETRYLEGIQPGMEIIGEPGEELQGFSPNVPNAEYFNHVKLTLQIIGVNLGLPLCLVLMDGSETNFSGWRGAVDEARKGFRAHQRNIIERFHSPVYRWKVAQWLSEDAAMREAARKPKVNVYGHSWTAPRWGYIDPVGDAQGDTLRLQGGLVSPRRLHAERGFDFEEVAEETIADQAYAISKAKKQAAAINKKYPDDPPVHWRELISLPMPQGIQMTMQDPAVVELQTEQVQDGPSKQEPAGA